MLLWSSLDWVFYGCGFLLLALAVKVTNTSRCVRLLRLLVRNLLVLSLLFPLSQLILGILLVPALPGASGLVSSSVVSDDQVTGNPSLSAVFMDRVLAAAGSPAVGTGEALARLSLRYQVDDAYALATFQHESSYGKYGVARVNRSLGNIICAGYPTCNGRFRVYATWEEGYEDFYQLIAHEYVARGLMTVGRIIPVYAPARENDTTGYIEAIRHTIAAFRAGRLV